LSIFGGCKTCLNWTILKRWRLGRRSFRKRNNRSRCVKRLLQYLGYECVDSSLLLEIIFYSPPLFHIALWGW
jgi:hypothetical protein